MGGLSDVDAACTVTSDCNIENSFCNSTICACSEDFPVFIPFVNKCVARALLNASCIYDQQCTKELSRCDPSSKRCVCLDNYQMKDYQGFGLNCVGTSGNGGMVMDPAVVGAVIGLVVMFVFVCLVLRLFSKERFRENRSIFNTPNPRLMNASLFKESKLLSPARGERRGSRASIRGPPSRAPSLTSVNKDGCGKSPNGSLAKGRRGSTLSNVSAAGSTSGTPAGTSAKIAIQPASTKEPQETTVSIETVD